MSAGQAAHASHAAVVLARCAAVATGTVGELSLSGVTTIEGLAEAIERGYRNRIPEERVWLFDGSASVYVKTSAPRGQPYHV
jgi:hypothetical protein